MGDVPLKIQYEDLYKMVSDPNCFVEKSWEGEEWVMEFIRSLSVQEHNRWLELVDGLHDFSLSSDIDSVKWALDKSNIFTTKSLYRFLSDSGASSRVAGYIWKSKLPLKIKFFLWQVFNNKLQVAKSLAKRGWKGNSRCCLCNCVEDVNHILFKCHFAKFAWGMPSDLLCIQDFPKSLREFSSSWLLGKDSWPKRLMMFVIPGFAWALWTCRNKMMIEKHLPKTPTDVVYIGLSFMQKWSGLLREEDRERITHLKEDIMRWLKDFKTSAIMLSDAVEV